MHRKFLDAQASLARTLVRRSVGQSLTHTFRFPLCRCLCTFTDHPKITGRDIFLKAMTGIRYRLQSIFFQSVFFRSKHPLRLLPANRKGKDCGRFFTQLDTAVGYWILDTAVGYNVLVGYWIPLLDTAVPSCRSLRGLLRNECSSLLHSQLSISVLTKVKLYKVILTA